MMSEHRPCPRYLTRAPDGRRIPIDGSCESRACLYIIHLLAFGRLSGGTLSAKVRRAYSVNVRDLLESLEFDGHIDSVAVGRGWSYQLRT